ncbi:MAG TPA: TetR/AcrR family transcriptional regulator [Cellvibrionaceae bacterium]
MTATEKKTGYHHGNLREALLDTALQALKTESLDSLSLRGLAKSLGVSPTAVYGHFADKTALLIELRTLGFQQLSQHLQQAYDSTTDAEARVRTLAYAYMNFGQQQTHLFDALFTWVPELERITPECIEAGNNSEAILQRALVEMLRQCGEAPTDHQAAIASFSAWSLVHGITLLMKSGCVEGAVYCGKWPEYFSAEHPQSQQPQIIEHLLTIELEGLKAAVKKLPPP